MSAILPPVLRDLPPAEACERGQNRCWDVPGPFDGFPALLGAWLLDQPGSHPLWRLYLVTVVHLRPVEGVPAPVLRFEGATHEVIVRAMLPGGLGMASEWRPAFEAVDPRRVETIGPAVMAGSMVGVQLGGLHDDGAVETARRLVKMAVHGLLSADTDDQRAWDRAAGQLSAHFRGEHARGEA